MPDHPPLNDDIIARMSAAQKFLARSFSAISTTGPGQWLFSRLAHRLDMLVLRITGGQRLLSEMLTDLPLAVLTTTGAKSGLPRRAPVMVTYAAGLPVLIASNWGQSQTPAWHYNLLANPRAVLEIDSHTESYLARLTEGAERENYWALAVKQYPGYKAYRSRAAGREIGVWLLEPEKDSPRSTQRTQREL